MWWVFLLLSLASYTNSVVRHLLSRGQYVFFLQLHIFLFVVCSVCGLLVGDFLRFVLLQAWSLSLFSFVGIEMLVVVPLGCSFVVLLPSRMPSVLSMVVCW